VHASEDEKEYSKDVDNFHNSATNLRISRKIPKMENNGSSPVCQALKGFLYLFYDFITIHTAQSCGAVSFFDNNTHVHFPFSIFDEVCR